jgi:hypothetical protein
MVYRLSMNVDENIILSVEEQVFEDLLETFEKMGGDTQWLINTAKSAVARSLHGDPVGNVVRSMNGSVVDAPEEDANAASRSRRASRADEDEDDAGTTRTARRSEDKADPWAKDRDDYPGEASVAREAVTGSTKTQSRRQSDPWGAPIEDDEPEERPRQRRSAPRDDDEGGVTVTKDKFNREWTIGLEDAPDCACGIPAARMKAKAQKTGKWYTQWRCSKAAGSDYKNKCSYSEFPD